MMRTRFLRWLFFIACFSALIMHGCSSVNQQESEKLGELNFSVTGKGEAQPYFKKGLLLLHSFEYEDAAENFSKAREIDNDFVMAYWGEAMTYNHALWRYQDRKKADSILQLLAPTPEKRVSKARTPVEKDFISAVNLLYGEGNKAERDLKYAYYMSELYKKYPDNLEVASFYSIALLGSVEVGRDTKVYEHAAEVAKEVLANNPNHPGALHYLIHSYDDPDHAALALDAADAYAKVAPSASHALHMPSHIYLALGLWDKVISSNEAAWAAGEERKERKQLGNNALGYHAFHWLMYAYLQNGRKEDGGKIVEQMQQYCNGLPSERAREHMILIKSTYLVETNDWLSAIDSIEVKQDDLNIALRAMNNFVDGMNSYYKNDLKTLSGIISRMEEERLSESKKITSSSVYGCTMVKSSSPNLLDVQYAEVMENELKGMQAWLKKDTFSTDDWLKQATGLENSISYSFGPPSVVKPSNELYGEWLLDVHQPEQALQQFEFALKAAPNRKLSMDGKARAMGMIKSKQAIAKK